eukprot:10215645-Prorocentrum_lima.AAC.1
MAFDTVSHERMILALRRMSVPEKLLNAVTSMYTNPPIEGCSWVARIMLAKPKGRHSPRMPFIT